MNSDYLASLALTVLPRCGTAGEWTGNNSSGYYSVSGNSKNISVSPGLDGSYTADSWHHGTEAEPAFP